MIIRKPYAFLIKYFKIIHIVLFLIFVYLVFEMRNIYMFFVNYVRDNNFTYYEGMANKYMNPLVFFMIILIIGFAISVYELMKKKEKPIFFYKILIVYGIVLLIFWIYFRNFFTSLEKTTYDPLNIIIYRDITAFLYYLNFFYVGFSFIRGFGFDIKKFSFDKDKKELHLDETDNEEVELSIGVDKDNVTNYIRRERREFRYYLKENATILIIILVILIIGGGIFAYFTFYDKAKIYVEKENVTVNNVSYKINQSMITSLDKYSEEISSNNYFLIVNFELYTSYKSIVFDEEMFRVNVNDKYYYPVYNYNNLFDDLGIAYRSNLSLENSKNFIIIYRIPKEEIKSIFFEILKSKNGGYQFEKVKLSPIYQNQEVSKLNYDDENTIDNYAFKIVDYKIEDQTSFEYENCYNEVCTTLNKIVVPKLNEKVLSLKLDTDKINKDFFENYLGVKYQESEKEVTVSSKDVSIINTNNNVIYFSVPKYGGNYDTISLIFKTRTNIYEMELKDNK